jgi:toxin ParE1/3/4
MSRAKYTQQAQEDILDIAAFIAADNAQAARRLMAKILRSCERLHAQPQSGRLRPEIAPNVRSFPIEKYLISYRAARGGVEVLRVLHGARDISALM